MLWIGRRSFLDLRNDKVTKGDRYWLIISFVGMNLLIIFSSLLTISNYISVSEFNSIRGVLGIGMIYLASTSLLRIYPQSIKLVERKIVNKTMSEQDKIIIQKIQDLLDLDKVYQEANFSRADLARELNISEANVSKIIMSHFGKSLPQLINELRIRDSLQLLKQTEATISVIAEQVGFSALPTFNRVFKDTMNMSPSEFRQTKKTS
jgi:AraC-like DNA-binding protein